MQSWNVENSDIICGHFVVVEGVDEVGKVGNWDLVREVLLI